MDEGRTLQPSPPAGPSPSAGAGTNGPSPRGVRRRPPGRGAMVINVESVPKPVRKPRGVGAPGLTKKHTRQDRLGNLMAVTKNSHKTKDKQKVIKPEFKNVLPFEPTLAYAFRTIGGKESAIGGARLLAETDKRFLKIVTAFDTLNDSDKSSVRLEDLCEGAEITPGEFLGLVTKALWERNADIGRLIAAVNHPKVIESTIEHSASVF